jgi:hypothetical protein
VVGLAPSAAAAAQLRNQSGADTDTLAKLTWSIEHDDLPGWAQRIGPATLVVIDEAGMADTLSLDTTVQYVGRCRLRCDCGCLGGPLIQRCRRRHGVLSSLC